VPRKSSTFGDGANRDCLATRCLVRALALATCGSLLFSSFAPRSYAGVSTQFYVAPNGSDAGDGSRAQPFATLARAQAAAQLAVPTMAGDIVFNIRGGTYQLTQPLELTAAPQQARSVRRPPARYSRASSYPWDIHAGRKQDALLLHGRIV